MELRHGVLMGAFLLIFALVVGHFAVVTAQQEVATYGRWFVFSNTRCQWSSGSGSPEGVVTGNPCDIYVRSDAGPSTPILYVKLSGAGTATGWTVYQADALLSSNVEAVPGSKYPTVADNNKLFTNEGDTDGNSIVLPNAEAGLRYTIYVQVAQTVTVTAQPTDTIRIAASVTGVGGHIHGSAIGTAVTLAAINTTEWVAVSSVGTWTF